MTYSRVYGIIYTVIDKITVILKIYRNGVLKMADFDLGLEICRVKERAEGVQAEYLFTVEKKIFLRTLCYDALVAIQTYTHRRCLKDTAGKREVTIL